METLRRGDTSGIVEVRRETLPSNKPELAEFLTISEWEQGKVHILPVKFEPISRRTERKGLLSSLRSNYPISELPSYFVYLVKLSPDIEESDRFRAFGGCKFFTDLQIKQTAEWVQAGLERLTGSGSYSSSVSVSTSTVAEIESVMDGLSRIQNYVSMNQSLKK